MLTHHAGQGEQCGLDLSHVPIFKQVICLKDVTGLQTIGKDSLDEIPKVFQLQIVKKKNYKEGWYICQQNQEEAITAQINVLVRRMKAL